MSDLKLCKCAGEHFLTWKLWWRNVYVAAFQSYRICFPFRVLSCHPAFPQCHLRIDLCAWVSHLTVGVCDFVKMLTPVLWSSVLPSPESIKMLTFVLWSAGPPSSVASKCKPFSIGKRVAFLRINRDVNLRTWVKRSQVIGHPLVHSSACWEHRQLCVLGKHYLIWLQSGEDLKLHKKPCQPVFSTHSAREESNVFMH